MAAVTGDVALVAALLVAGATVDAAIKQGTTAVRGGLRGKHGGDVLQQVYQRLNNLAAAAATSWGGETPVGHH